MLDAQTMEILRVGSPKISTAGGKISTSTLAMLAAFCISDMERLGECPNLPFAALVAPHDKLSQW